MSKAGAKPSRRRVQPVSSVTAEVYERLWRLNQGFAEVRRCLRELGAEQFGTFSRRQMRPYEEWVEELQAAINSHLLGELESSATERAGRLFRRRQARETAEEQGP